MAFPLSVRRSLQARRPVTRLVRDFSAALAQPIFFVLGNRAPFHALVMPPAACEGVGDAVDLAGLGRLAPGARRRRIPSSQSIRSPGEPRLRRGTATRP